ncbi:hypothetical protein VTK26DRAFT_7979 [Humicola hyalothermophila]
MDKHTQNAPLVPGTGGRSSDDNAVWSLRHLQLLWSWAARPSKPAYPPISAVRRTSTARLFEADASPTPFPSKPILAKTARYNAPSKSGTVLYLAYGSNMCAKTFLGMRGIRPLSQINVAAPSLDLTFDLPGLPYREPCFANTAIRKVPAKPPVNPPKFPPRIPDHPPIKPPAAQGEDNDETSRGRRRGDPVWDKGLYGVVYEVTEEDYAKIVATEGGGASYHDILVPCFVLPTPSFDTPEKEKPSVPVPPTPFLAHTLYAPRLWQTPDDDDGQSTSSSSSSSSSSSPSISLFRPRGPRHRADPNYAQPSERYLNLLRTGAREHGLPAPYQEYLASLRPYTITTRRQRLGQTLFLGLWLPFLVAVMVAGRALADKRGRSPAWLALASTALFNLIWGSYDLVGKPIFGDGERTMDDDEGPEEKVSNSRRGSFASGLRGKEEAGDEEKTALLYRE